MLARTPAPVSAARPALEPGPQATQDYPTPADQRCSHDGRAHATPRTQARLPCHAPPSPALVARIDARSAPSAHRTSRLRPRARDSPPNHPPGREPQVCFTFHCPLSAVRPPARSTARRGPASAGRHRRIHHADQPSGRSGCGPGQYTTRTRERPVTNAPRPRQRLGRLAASRAHSHQITHALTHKGKVTAAAH